MMIVRRNGARGAAAAVAIVAGTGLAVAQPQFAYVPNAGDGTVSAIELSSDSVAWTLAVGDRAAHGIAASADGSVVYAGDAAAQEVVVIDALRQTVVARIPVPFHVHGIDIAPDGKTVWAGGLADNDPVRGTLAVINTATNRVEDIVSPNLGAASHFAFTPDSKEVWIASTSTNLVWVVDVDSRLVAAAIPLSLPAGQQRPEPGDSWGAFLAGRQLIGLNEVAVSPDGAVAYAVGPAVSELFAIDVETRSVTSSVHGGDRAHGVTVSPDSSQVWIADWTGEVSILDAATLSELARTRLTAPDQGAKGPGANHLAFTPDGQRVYVTSGNSVVVLEAATGEVMSRFEVGTEPHEISLEDLSGPAAPQQDASGPPDQALPAKETAAAEGPATDLKRVNSERAVTVEITPLDRPGAGDMLEFRVVLDTHAVELDDDLLDVAVMRDDKGNTYEPASWDGPVGGHHVEGTLSFGNRERIMASGTDYLELTITGVGGAPSRNFRWLLDELT